MDPLNMMRARLLQAHQQGLFNQQNSAPNLGISSQFQQPLTPEHNALLGNMPRPGAAIASMLMPRHMVSPNGVQQSRTMQGYGMR